MEFLGKIIFFSSCVLIPTLILMWFISHITDKSDRNDPDAQ